MGLEHSSMGAEKTLPARNNARIGWGLLLVLIAVIGVSALAATQMLTRVERSDETVRGELRPLVERYRAFMVAGDTEALAAWLDPAAEPAWRESVLQMSAAVAPPFTSFQLGKIGTLDENTDDIYQVELRGTIQQDGVTVPAYAYVFFRRTDGEWLPTFPVVDEYWGPATSFDSNGVTLTYRVEESQEILTAMSEVAALNRRLETVDPSLRVPALAVEIDPVAPIGGPEIGRAGDTSTIRLRSASVGWGAVEPTTHLRAQYADALLEALPASSDVSMNAGRRALVRYWVGQLNQAHPRFDTALIATARPLVEQNSWPGLVSVLSGETDLDGAERDAALTTAYLWLLSEGLDASNLQMLLEERDDADAIRGLLTEALDMSPTEIEAAWQEAAHLRYAPD